MYYGVGIPNTYIEFLHVGFIWTLIHECEEKLKVPISQSVCREVVDVTVRDGEKERKEEFVDVQQPFFFHDRVDENV